MRRWSLLGAVAAAALLAGVLAGPASRAAKPQQVTLRATFASFPDYLDPQLSYTFEGWTAMYETYVPLLTFRHANGRAGADIVPGLAAELPEITNGGRTYTLFLRQGLRYSDGTPVRASDFEYAIKRALKMYSGGSPLYTGIVGAGRFERRGRGGISGIVANDRTGRITIRLTQRNGTFSEALALPFAAPVPPSTPMRDLSFDPPPATGPYMIVGSVPGTGWYYARNPAWAAGNGQLMPELPGGQVDRIAVKVIHDAKTQVREVAQGRLDWVLNVPPTSEFRKLRRRARGTQLRTEPMLATDYFWMNTSKPPFNDLRVRKAANLAVDRRALRRIYGGQLASTQQILPRGMPGYRKFELYPYDLARARRLVAAAKPADRKVTVWTSSEPPNRAAAAYYRAQLEKIGLDARLKVLSADFYFSEIGRPSRPNLDTGWSDWFADYPHPDDFFRPLLHSARIHPFFNENFALFKAPALDVKLDQLRRKPLTAARERAYAALDRAYMKRAPWVPYGAPSLSTFVSKAVELDKLVWNPIIGPDLASFELAPEAP